MRLILTLSVALMLRVSPPSRGDVAQPKPRIDRVDVRPRIIPGDLYNRATQELIVSVRAVGGRRVGVIVSGPEERRSTVPLEERTMYFRYTRLESGRYSVLVALLDAQEGVIVTRSGGDVLVTGLEEGRTR